ncbi:MAG: T9SS type A sorting domain-containing protein [Bacteroidia bacterium]|nr:T9SS type A sorting domain-containing protein [Bacteroidia bacterium]
MKKIIIRSLLILPVVILIQSFGPTILGKRDGTEPGFTGSPGDSLKNCTVCHGGKATNVEGWITSTIPSTGFLPNTKYTITAKNTEVGGTRFGFSISPQSITGKLLGTLIISDTTTTKLVGDNKYVTYRAAGVDGVDSKTWTFDWIAPDSVNEVVFYGAFNSNFEGHKDGDNTYLSQLKVFKTGFTGVKENNLISSVSIFPNPLNNEAQLSFINKLHGNVEVSLYGLDGKFYGQLFNQQLSVGHQTILLEPNTKAGIYFLKITNSNSSIYHKILIQ